MKISTLLALSIAGANAAPFDYSSQDGGPGGHGSMAGMGGMAGMTGASGAKGAPTLDIAALLGNPALMSMAAKFLPEKKAMKIESIPPLLRKDAKRIRLTYGPYKLKGRASTEKLGNSPSMDPAGTSYSNMAAQDFPRDVTVLDANSMVTDENFKRVKTSAGLYDHHNVFFDFDSSPVPIVGCSNGKKPTTVPSNVFMAGATEAGNLTYTTLDGKFNSGFYLAPKANIYNGIDVANYNQDARTVYTVSEMEYIPGKIPGALAATQQVLNIGACNGIDGAAIHPQAGQQKMTLTGSDMVISRDGWLIQTRGHLHDGGLNMALSLNGKVVCDSKALYGGDGHVSVSPDGKEWKTIRETTVCSDPIKVTKGDKMDIVANYDFAEHPERETADGDMAEEMALLIVSFAEAQ